MDVARWIAADRGAFDEPEPQQFEAAELPPLPAFPIMARLTDDELVLIWAFRETLPCLE